LINYSAQNRLFKLQSLLMDVSVLHTVVVFLVVFLATVFSGMSGGGGGLIIVPFLLAVGLSPQQAIATTKFSGIGFSFGGIAAFKKKSFNNPLLLIYLIILGVFISLLVPTLFRSLSGNVFQIAIGIMMIALIPVTLSDKNGLKTVETSSTRKFIGGILIGVTFLLQGVFSSGVGILNNLVLMSFFGLKALDASAIQRVAVLALNAFIVISLATTTNFIIWQYAIAGAAAAFLGGYTGSRIALKRGERFAKYALAVFMLIAGVLLLVDAIK
jgi:uncharacterized membrane protein YfcA